MPWLCRATAVADGLVRREAAKPAPVARRAGPAALGQMPPGVSPGPASGGSAAGTASRAGGSAPVRTREEGMAGPASGLARASLIIQGQLRIDTCMSRNVVEMRTRTGPRRMSLTVS